jgi:hypothetical protein
MLDGAKRVRVVFRSSLDRVSVYQASMPDLIHQIPADLLQQNVLASLDLLSLIAVAATSHSCAVLAVPRIEEEKARVGRAWAPKFTTLGGQLALANIAATALVDEAVHRPQELLWAGVVEPTVALLQRCGPTSLTTWNACAILYQLSTFSTTTHQLVRAKAVQPLIDILLQMPPAIDMLLEMPPTNGTGHCSAAKYAALILSNALADNVVEEYRAIVHAQLQTMDTLVHLVALLERWSDDWGGLGKLCGMHPVARLLSQLAARGSDSRRALGDAGCVEQAVNLLRHSRQDVRKDAFHLLCNLVTEPSNAAKAHAAGGVALLSRRASRNRRWFSIG